MRQSDSPNFHPKCLIRWLLVEPSEGVVLSGNDIEVSVTILVKEGVMEEIDVSDHPFSDSSNRISNCYRLDPVFDSGRSTGQLQSRLVFLVEH